MVHNDRKRIWIDRFQTELTMRIVAYLVLFLFVFLNFLFAGRLLYEGPKNLVAQFFAMLYDYGAVIICLVFLAPFLVWDAVRFAHRLVGPLTRFRATMSSIAEGDPVNLVKLREGDYLTEFRDEFNTMLESLERRGVAILKPLNPTEPNTNRREPA